MGNFDHYAESYQRIHTENVRVTGEDSEYFALYKARYIARRMGARFSGRILDYGCGVGMISKFLKQELPLATVDGFDISDASLDKVDPAIRAQGIFTSDWNQVGSEYDLIVVTNVMHHVPPAERPAVIARLRDHLAHEGKLIIVEHNPLNPLTRWAVATCAFDDDAILLPTAEARGYVSHSGLNLLRRDYIVFFPRLLAWLRPLEPFLGWCPAGAQYALIAQRTGMPGAISIPESGVREDCAPESIATQSAFEGATVYQRVFSFATMLGMVLVGCMFHALRSFNVDPDLWWHLKYGEGILATHHWPTVEQFSFTAAGQRWLAYEWLGDVLFAAVYRLGGLQGLGILLIVLGSLFAVALYYYTTLRCGNPKAGFVATVILLSLVNSFNLRPQMLGYLFLVVELIILEKFRRGRRGAVWFLPVLMVVWVNTHGTWIIGFAAMAVYLACGLTAIRIDGLEIRTWPPAQRSRFVGALLLSGLATLITPYGPDLAKFPFIVSSLPSGIASIQEWQPMAFHFPNDKLFLGVMLGFFLVGVALRPKWRVEDLGLFLFAAAMSFLHERFLTLFAVFSAPVVAVVLSRWVPAYERRKEVYTLNAALILSLAGAMVWYTPSQGDYAREVEQHFPVAAGRYLDTHALPGPMYNSYGFGGYLLWTRGAEQKVFVDGRTEVYERAGVFQDQVALANLKPGSLAILDKYKIQSCMLVPGEPLAAVLAVLPDWQKVYDGADAILFVRKQSGDEQSANVAIGRGNS